MNSSIESGTILANKYRVERVLGHGGMGVVVAATHLQLNQPVAVKLMLPQIGQNPEAVERFLREARSTVRLQSEHVARVNDVGTLDNGAPYIVMDLLVGSDLDAVVAERGPLPVADAVDFLLQAIAGVAEAHHRGIVHRDLKPANLFLTQRSDGSALVKVLDFGISKATEDGPDHVALTATSTAMGSPQYMSPEQIRNAKDVDVRSDVWSLGMILYELLLGVPAFGAQSAAAVLAAVIADTPQGIRGRRPDVSDALERVVLHCLEKDRAARFQTVGELARALAPFSPASCSLVASITQILGEVQRVEPGPHRERWRRGGRLLALMAVLSAAAVGYFVLRSRRAPDQALAAEPSVPASAPSAQSVPLTREAPSQTQAGTADDAAHTPVSAPVASSVATAVASSKAAAPQPARSQRSLSPRPAARPRGDDLFADPK